MSRLRWLAIGSLGLVLFLSSAREAEALRFLTTTDVSTTALWGPTSNGLRLSLSLNGASVQAGEPVLATIDLENLGPDRDVFLGCNMEGWYDIGIVDGQRRAIPHSRIGPVDCYSTSSSYSFKHNSVLETTLRIDDKFNIGEAGSYSVTATSIVHAPYQSHVDPSGNQLYVSPIITSLVSNSVEISVRAAAPSNNRSPQPFTPTPAPTVSQAHRPATTDVAPCRAIGGLKTTLFHPARGLALFNDRSIAASDESGVVSFFNHGATGNIPPASLIHLSHNSGSFIPLAVDLRTSELYVGSSRGNRVEIYRRIGNSRLTHVGSLSGNRTTLDQPSSLTFDSAGNLYVVDFSNPPAVLVFKHGSIGNVAPARRIAGPATALSTPVGIVISDHGEIFVSNDEHYPMPYSITVYSHSAIGNARPIRVLEAQRETISSVLDNRPSSTHYGRSQLNMPLGMSIASNKYLIVANAGASTVGVDKQGRWIRDFAITPPITAYNLHDQGDAKPAWTINGPSTDLSAPLTVASDLAGHLFVQNTMSPEIVEFCSVPK